MSDEIRVFVNERPVRVSPGATVREALLLFDSSLAGPLRTGAAYVTDGVGRPIEPSGAVEPGAIFRVVRSVRRAAGSES